MKSHVDARYLLGLGALFLWGCPIDDAKFKEPAGTSSSSSSSSGSEPSSSSTSSSSSSSGNGGNAGNGGAGGMGGVGGNGGAAGMGGAVTSSSSSSSSGGGMGGAAGMGGSGGGGPVCPDPGTVGSCGTPNCPPCPKLVVLGVETSAGKTSVFDSINGWAQAASVADARSDFPPAFAIIKGQAKGVALIRSTADGAIYPVKYLAWNAVSGFSAATNVFGTDPGTRVSPVAVASNTAVHASFLGLGTDYKYYYMEYDGTSFNPTNQIISNPTASLGYCAPGLTVLGTSVVFVNPGYGDESLYNRTRPMGAAGTWDAGYKYTTIPFLVDDVTPSITALESGPELLLVVTEKVAAKPLYWLTRSNGTWSAPASISGASSIETALLALPGGGAILAYRDYVTNAIYWSRFDGTMWTSALEIPGGMTTKSKPVLAFGAGDAVAELLFVDTAGQAKHARLHKGAANFTMPTMIPGAASLTGIGAATNL